MESSSRPAERAAAVAEWVLVTVLAMLLALQLLAYPTPGDADSDGYVQYASYLTENSKLLPDSSHLPGYPFFLAIVGKIGGQPLGLRVYWAQAVICVLGALLAWRVVRQQLGPLAALFLLGIIA